MSLQDDVDQKVTDDVQGHIGKLTYNNIILVAQVEALRGELTKTYDELNQLKASWGADAGPADTDGSTVQGEVVTDSGEAGPG